MKIYRVKQVVTVKLKLNPTPAQKNRLRAVSLAYRDALNHTSQIAFEKGKMSNGTKLQSLVYNNLRSTYGLPAQMACNIPRQVAATYKGLWVKLKQNLLALELGFTKKLFKGLEEPPKYVSRTCTLNYHRDYSFKKNQQVSIITLEGRMVLPYSGYNKHLELIHSDAKIGTGEIWYCKSSKTYYLLVNLELDIPEVEPNQLKRVVGVDVGQRYLAVSTDARNRTQFFSGKEVLHKANRYQKAIKRLQQKGTRSATKRLVALSERERRFTADVNHKVSKRIVTPNTLFGLEELSHIREQSSLKDKRNKRSKKEQKANRNQVKWFFAELHSFIDYKAILVKGMAVKVDADYTSKGCPRCGHVSGKSRPNNGLIFHCIACEFELHADLVAARNLALRTVLFRQDWERMGSLSVTPDASSKEAKAERLCRYSELRWTIDANPRPSLLERTQG